MLQSLPVQFLCTVLSIAQQLLKGTAKIAELEANHKKTTATVPSASAAAAVRRGLSRFVPMPPQPFQPPAESVRALVDMGFAENQVCAYI